MKFLFRHFRSFFFGKILNLSCVEREGLEFTLPATLYYDNVAKNAYLFSHDISTKTEGKNFPISIVREKINL